MTHSTILCVDCRFSSRFSCLLSPVSYLSSSIEYIDYQLRIYFSSIAVRREKNGFSMNYRLTMVIVVVQSALASAFTRTTSLVGAKCFRPLTTSITASSSTRTLLAIQIPTRKGRTTRLCSSSSVDQQQHQQLVQDMLYRIRQLNQNEESTKSIDFMKFQLDGINLGKVSPQMANTLVEKGGGVFEILNSHEGSSTKEGSKVLTLSDSIEPTPAARTKAIQSVTTSLRDQGMIDGWRDELYPISNGFYDNPLFLMERAAVSLLGVMEYGVHINGLCGDKMWMARRSATKSKFPGMLDHMVAGGQPAGLSLEENVIKECMEEAGVPEDLTRAGMQAAGAISYETYSERSDRVSRVVLFCYDLQLPESFAPKAIDGEVEEFFLWDMEQLKESIRRDYHDPIKPNCYAVIIDYLLRTGNISPQVDGYLDVLRELRSGDCQ